MFIPLFLALWLGLISSADVQNTQPNNGTVHISSNGMPDDPGLPTDSIPGDDTGGQTGHNPPKP